MALITFTSDFGLSDHYVAAVKAKILGFNPNLKIVDISHHIEHFNIAHGSFVLSSVFRDFPKGTIHLIAVHSPNNQPVENIVMKLEDHFFIGYNNGLLGLVSQDDPAMVIELNNFNNELTTFPERDLFAPAAARLASGGNLHDLGKKPVTLKKLMGRLVKATKKQISGHVVRVDTYGNLITNIPYKDFSFLSAERKYSISFGRESMNKVHENYGDVDPGDCFVIFNSLGFMEIGINHGNAAELLGLGFDSSVNVNFLE